MPIQSSQTLEFGEFVLYPSEKILLHLDKAVRLNGVDFEILSYLARHPNVPISENDLIEAGWGKEAKLAPGNVSHHISKIRKRIGCDARRPKFIRTLYNYKKNAYCFIGQVRALEKDLPDSGSIVAEQPRGGRYKLTAHFFAPIFLGQDIYRRLTLADADSDWGENKIWDVESAKLRIYPTGVGVWQLAKSGSFSRVWQIAAWRKQIYREIMDRKHPLWSHTRELLRSMGETKLRDEFSKPGYVFSAIALESSTVKQSESITNALKAMCELTSFESNDPELNEKREIQMISGNLDSRGIEGFGTPDIDPGFASWDGVAYYCPPSYDRSLVDSLIEYESAVQGLWWACKSFCTLRVRNHTSSNGTSAGILPAIRKQFRQLKTVLANETPSQRSMVEAILDTSRITQMVESATEDALG